MDTTTTVEVRRYAPALVQTGTGWEYRSPCGLVGTGETPLAALQDLRDKLVTLRWQQQRGAA